MGSPDHKFDLVVSIVTYNPHKVHLQETIDSLSRTDLNIKIAIHDNSSERFNYELSSSHHLEVFHNGANEGFGAGHNKNISKCIESAPYFLILNPDIYFDKDLLPELIRRLNKDQSIGLAIPKILYPSGDQQSVNKRLPRPQDYVMSFVRGKLGEKTPFSSKSYSLFLLKDLDHSRSFLCPVISGCFMFFRSSVLKDLGGFDPRYFLYFEDTDLSRRTAMIANTVVFSDLNAYHHWARGAHRSPRLFIYFIGNMIRYFNKWGWLRDPERDLINQKVRYYPEPSQKN